MKIYITISRTGPMLKTPACYTAVWLLLLILQPGCRREPDYTAIYGLNYNSERLKRGITPIPAGCTMQESAQGFDCLNPHGDETKPLWLRKGIGVDNQGNIISETDDFYSGKIFYYGPEHVKQFEGVSITYIYNPKTNSGHWQVHARLATNATAFGGYDTLDKAEHILHDWGLNRTNIHLEGVGSKH